MELLRQLSSIIEEQYEDAQQLKNVGNSTIMRSIRQKIRGGTFHFFGSRVMGVGTEHSDIDVFISFGNSYYKSLSPKRIQYFINLLERKLRDDEGIWRVQSVVRDWHVSFIRALYIPEGVTVDITFNNGLAVENTLLLRHLFDIQPEAAKFCLLIKKWLKLKKVSIKNYNVVLLCIFYLQQQNYLPSIEDVQSGLEEDYIDGYEVQFNDSCNLYHYQVNKMRDFDDVNLVAGFFEYYRDLDYSDGVISPHTGCIEDFSRFDDWKRKHMNLCGPIITDRNNALQFGYIRFKKFLKCMRESANDFTGDDSSYSDYYF